MGLYNEHVNADVDWLRCLEEVFRHGTKTSPRGQDTFEILGMQSVVSMHNPIIYNPTRELGYRFMAAEAAWILSGRDDVASIAPYSKEISKFSDNGQTFFGAYGPKITAQMPHVISSLRSDPDSRQAVVNIWRESPPKSKDIPCTLSLQFLIRQNKLHCVASMRSSDLWLGHPYDIFNFSAVSFAILLELSKGQDMELELGNLHLTAGSKHLYQRNVEGVSKIMEAQQNKGMWFAAGRRDVFKLQRYEKVSDFIDHLWSCAESSGGAQELEN